MENSGIIILGILLSCLGVINMSGNISSIHWYNRTKITEQTRKPFGRLMGCGTLIIGISFIVTGIILIAFEWIYAWMIALIGAVAGVALSLYALLKYNKGIF